MLSFARRTSGIVAAAAVGMVVTGPGTIGARASDQPPPMVGIVAAPDASEPDDDGDREVRLRRFEGADRADTAVVVSQQTYPEQADVVVIARKDQYPDALAGGPLAFAVDAPILLTNHTGLDPVVAEEVERLGPVTAYVLGGPDALSAGVTDALRARGVDDITRLAGRDRFETAAVIAGELLAVSGRSVASDVYLTEGANPDPRRGWPDAVSVAPLAAHQGRPVLLLRQDRLPSATSLALDDLGVTNAIAVGGPTAIAEEVLDQVRGLGVDTDRVAGDTRYATSRAVADLSRTAGLDPERTWFATGHTFADALVSGPAVARDGGVLLLLDGQDLDASPPALAWIDEFRTNIRTVNLLGGPVAISSDVESRIVAELSRRP